MGRLTIIFATSIVGLTAACHDNQQQAQDPSSMAMTTAAPVATTPVAPVEGTSMPKVASAAPGDSAPTGTSANGGANTTAANPKGTTATNTPAPTPAPTTTAPTNPNADNSRMNATASGSAGLTAADQGGSEGDRKMTQQIRKAVMADGSLSFMAKNVKIITINGKVTLKGPVKSDQERLAIVNAAKKVAGASQVDNQLEIKQ